MNEPRETQTRAVSERPGSSPGPNPSQLAWTWSKRLVPVVLSGVLTYLLIDNEVAKTISSSIAGSFNLDGIPAAVMRWVLIGIVAVVSFLVVQCISFTIRFRWAPHRRVGDLAIQVADGPIPDQTVSMMLAAYQRDPVAAEEATEIFRKMVDVPNAAGFEHHESQKALREFVNHGIEVLQRSVVPSVLQPHFEARVEHFADEVVAMGRGVVQPYKSKLDQFDLAGLIARFFVARAADNEDDRGLITVYATSLDSPTQFKSDYGAGYFAQLARLQSAFKHDPSTLSDAEASLLPNDFQPDAFVQEKRLGVTQLERYLEGDFTPEFAASESALGVRCARLCVLPLVEFVDEIESSAKMGSRKHGLADYVMWHWLHGFAVRFVLLEEFVAPQRLSGLDVEGNARPHLDREELLRHRDELWASYANHLRGHTIESPEHGIDDFIVYDDEIVFGRVVAAPTAQEDVLVRIIAPSRADKGTFKELPLKYRDFFANAWSYSSTIGELLAKVARTGLCSEENCERVAEQILKRVDESGDGSFREEPTASASAQPPAA